MKSRVADVKVFEVTFTVEGVDEEGEFYTDGTTALVVADSIEQAFAMVKEMRTLHGENVVGIEGVNFFTDSLIVPEGLTRL